MQRAAYRLLAPGLLGAALASPAMAAPAEAPPPSAAKAAKGTKQPASNADAGKGDDKSKTEADKSKTGADKSDKPETASPQPEQPGPAQKAEKPASGSETKPAQQTKNGAVPAGSADENKAPPPPPEPRADEQQPRPYLKLPPADKPSRMVELGPHIGVGYLPANGAQASYDAGFAWGAHARIELAPWMGFRVSFTNSTHAVTVPDGGLGLPAGTRIDQPALSVLLLRARLEPTWVVSPRLRLWAGVGAGWGRISAPALSTAGTEAGLQSAERKGVMLEFSGEVGASFDIIPDWLTTSLLVSGGIVTNQSGEVFSPSQAFTADGHRVQLDGLPHFGSSLSALLGVGVLL